MRQLRSPAVDLEVQAGDGPGGDPHGAHGVVDALDRVQPAELDHAERITLRDQVVRHGVDHVRDHVHLEPGQVLLQVVGLPMGERDHGIGGRGEGQEAAREPGLTHRTGVARPDLLGAPARPSGCACLLAAADGSPPATSRRPASARTTLAVGQVHRHDPPDERVAHHRHRRIGDRRVGEHHNPGQPSHQPVQPVGDPVIAGEGLIRPAAPGGAEPLVPALVVVHRGRLGQPSALPPGRQGLVDLRLRVDRGDVRVPPGVMEHREPPQPRARQATLLLTQVAEDEQRDGVPSEVGAGVGHRAEDIRHTARTIPAQPTAGPVHHAAHRYQFVTNFCTICASAGRPPGRRRH